MKRLSTAAVAAAALWMAACSNGGGPTIQPPPPTGNFTKASLHGTYAFVTTGQVITPSAETPFARTGSFTADGVGGIQTNGVNGVYDLVDAGGSGTTPSNPNPITGGSYTVNPDGRGTLTLNVNANGAPGSISFAFVLTSGSSGPPAIASDGLLIDETVTTACSPQCSTGSGNFVLQDTAKFGISNISGPYVFDFTGFDASPSAESLVGQFNATNANATNAGTEDSNDNGALNSGNIVAGPFIPDAANMATSGRGTVVIASQTYVFYIVDSSRVRFISSNSSGVGPMLTGDAVSQSSSLPASASAINGSFAFLVGGIDANGNGLTRVGRFTATSGALSKILMDVNDNASESELSNLTNGSITTFDPTTGRGMLSFSTAITTYSFVFYLSSQTNGVFDGVIQETTSRSGTAVVVDDGSLAGQSGNPFTASNISGNYVMNWSGQVTAGGNGITDEEDLLSQVKVSNLMLSGTSDYFQFTTVTLTTDAGTSGQITLNGDGTSNNSMTVNLSNTSAIHMVVYIVSPQLAFFENSDNNGTNRIVAGILKAQQ